MTLAFDRGAVVLDVRDGVRQRGQRNSSPTSPSTTFPAAVDAPLGPQVSVAQPTQQDHTGIPGLSCR
jgi:hypothetical protein